MADNQDFFAEDVQEGAQQEVPEKIKIGEKEYSQDDLDKLVGLGEKAVELEEKWNTKIDRLYPEYTKKTQELSEYKTKLEDLEKAKEQQVQVKASEGQQLTPEEQAQLIKQELKKYGVVTAEDVYNYIGNFNQAVELKSKADNVLEGAKSDGKPVATRDELLAYMDENGVKNPDVAYKLMFENELKDWETKQVNKLKQPGLETERSSSAGSKEPAPVKVTKENLSSLLQAAFEE